MSDAPSFDLEPEALQALTTKLGKLMAEALEAERSDPVIAPVAGGDLRALLDEPLPRSGCDPAEVMDVWRERILPYCRRNGHPRFFGYVCTTADPLGAMADAMASSLNQPVTAWRSTPAAAEIERLAVRWLDELVGFGSGGNGLLVSGGSSANFHALACAVARAEVEGGLPTGSRHRLTAYMSREAHVSLRKALLLLGLRPMHVRLMPMDERRRLVTDGLADAIRRDRESGLVPAVVCASAGTANTGAIDPLVGIADVCQSEHTWFHVDGSYGAPAVLTETYAWMKAAFRRADSMSLDPHKWLFAPVDAGCVLVRDDQAMTGAFSLSSEYTEVTQTDPIERYALFDRGVEMSRRFRGLKVWTILKARGVDAIRSVIEHDIALRRHLDGRVAEHPRLESLGSDLSLSCFRYVPEGEPTADALNLVNRRILEGLVESGRFYMSPTTLGDRYALRVCIVSFRTRVSDIDELVDEVVRRGREASEPGA